MSSTSNALKSTRLPKYIELSKFEHHSITSIVVLFEHLYLWQLFQQLKFYKGNEILAQKPKQWREKVKR